MVKARVMRWIPAVAVLIGLVHPAVVQAGAKEEKKVNDAAAVMSEIMAIPEKGIPPELLRNAEGIAIIPGLLKAGFVIGGRYGTGVVAVRRSDGRWSNPTFVYLAGGSFGLQIGAQSTDIVLVFKTSRSIDAMKRGKFTLGADASVAAGPVGRHAEAATDIMLKAEIYSYSRSRGLFAGVALEGAALQIDDNANIDFYNKPAVSVDDIFAGKVKAPAAAGNLRKVLEKYTVTRKGRR